MSPYNKLISIIGLSCFWLCFGSLWAERAKQRLDLPLNPFSEWADDGTRAEGITMIAIYICWPLVLMTLYLLMRVAQHADVSKSRWERLPAPFGLHNGLRRGEKTAYRLFFLVLFWVVPMIHVCHFAHRFFYGSPPAKMFHWTFRAWLKGVGGSSPEALYGDLTYFGWTPLLVIGALIGMAALTVAWLRALKR